MQTQIRYQQTRCSKVIIPVQRTNLPEQLNASEAKIIVQKQFGSCYCYGTKDPRMEYRKRITFPWNLEESAAKYVRRTDIIEQLRNPNTASATTRDKT